MKHFMKLDPKPFEMIATGKKTIELRLYDEKRRMIRVGDEIEFTCTNNAVSKRLTVRVAALYCFKDFRELYKKLPLEKCGYAPSELEGANPSDMEKYYSVEKQEKYGVVGIETELIK